jgi:hypothetical protein
LKTAYDLMMRINTLTGYIDAVYSGKNAISNWNEEFGEGNAEASVLENLINELKQEREDIEKKLRSIELCTKNTQ